MVCRQQEIHVFEPRLIARGPDEIRGQVGSHAFIYTKYCDPKRRPLVRPAGVCRARDHDKHLGMLKALFGPEADSVYEQVVSIGDVYGKNEQGHSSQRARSGRTGTGARSDYLPSGKTSSAGLAFCATGRWSCCGVTRRVGRRCLSRCWDTWGSEGRAKWWLWWGTIGSIGPRTSSPDGTHSDLYGAKGAGIVR